MLFLFYVGNRRYCIVLRVIFAGSDNLDLILEYAEWVIRVNHEDGLMVLFAAMLSGLVLLLLRLLPGPGRVIFLCYCSEQRQFSTV